MSVSDDFDLSWMDGLNIERAGPGQSQPSYFSSAEIAVLAAPFIIERCLARKPFSSDDVQSAVPEFSVYKTLNAIGTALAHGVKGAGMGLKKEKGLFVADLSNACLALKAFRAGRGDLSGLATKLGFESFGALVAAIQAL